MSLSDRYLTVSQAIKYSGLSKNKISKLIKQGRLPGEKIGRQILIEKAVLNTILKEHRDNIDDGFTKESHTDIEFAKKYCDRCHCVVSNNDIFCLNCGIELEE
jgi:excisionase family DNA binding protein